MDPVGGRVTHVEVLDRRRRVRARHRLRPEGLTVGRALDNDVVVDDRYLCPHHARIVVDDVGSVCVEDRESVNGIFAAGGGDACERIAVGPSQSVELGHTVLRFRDVDEPVEAALVDHSRRHSLCALLSGGAGASAAVVAAVVVFLAGAYLGSWERIESQQALLQIGALTGAAVLWAAGWSFASRVVAHEWRFRTHIAIFGAFLAIDTLVEAALGYTMFVYPTLAWWSGVELFVAAVVAAWMFDTHLEAVTSMPARRRTASAAAVSFGIVGLVALSAYFVQDLFSTSARFSGALKPIPVALLPAQSVDGFVGDLSALRERVDDAKTAD